MSGDSDRPRLILGSASPRRLELLAQIGIVPDDVRPADIDETPMPDERPQAYCRRIALGKCEALASGTDDIVLTADTTVALGRRILGKPENREEADRFLQGLSGRRHKVVTSVAVGRQSRRWFRDVVSTVRMKRMTELEIDSYLDTGDWHGKAGGYAIQGPAASLIPWIQGSYTAIVGLPLAETAGLLQAAGYPVHRRVPE